MSNMNKNSFIFIGRSGSGKGTQAALLIQALKKSDPNREPLYVQTGQELRQFIQGSSFTQKITKKHSVSQVQNRDEIKINEIINCGYTPYIIKDMGRYNPIFVNEEFEKFLKIYNLRA